MRLFSSFMVPMASGMNDCFASLAMTKGARIASSPFEIKEEGLLAMTVCVFPVYSLYFENCLEFGFWYLEFISRQS
jgi:hypothetical protein